MGFIVKTYTFKNQVRHMEEDEPEVEYEVAWVDNGSGPDSSEVQGGGLREVGGLVDKRRLSTANQVIVWGGGGGGRGFEFQKQGGAL